MKNTILIGMCLALGAGFASVRAADTPVQAAARAALLQKLNKVDQPQIQPPPEPGTPSVTAAAQPVQAATNVIATVPDQAVPPPTAPVATTREAASAAAALTAPAAPPEAPPAPAAPVSVLPTPVEPATTAPVTTAPVTTAPVIVARATAKPAPGARVTHGEGAGPATASDQHPRMTLSMVFVLLVVLVPLLAFAGATIWQRRQRRRLGQSLLTDPAASALVRARSIQADQMVERVENDILAACGSCALAAVGAVVIGLWLPRPLSVFASSIFLAGFAFLGGFLMFRAMRRFRAVQNIRWAPAEQPRVAVRVESDPVKKRQSRLNGESAATQEPEQSSNGQPGLPEPQNGGLNGQPVVAKARVVRRRKTVSTRPRVRPEAR